MDEKDIEILKAVADMETKSSKRLQEATGIPESTLYYRLENLRDSGVVTNDLYDLDLEEIGFNMTVIVNVIADYDEDYHEIVGEKISEIEGVTHVFFTMGEVDLVVLAQVASQPEVERLISEFEAIDEVRRTQSKFVISTIKEEPRLLKTYAPDSLKGLLDGQDVKEE